MKKLLFTLLCIFPLIIFGQTQVTLSGASDGNGNFATIHAAFAAIPANQTDRNITITINANTTSTLTTTITNKGWATLTIKPASGTSPTITGSFVGTLLTLNGVNNVIVDGSNNGTTSRNLTIINTNSTSASSTIIVNGGSTYNTIKNCVLKGSGNQSTGAVVVLGSTANGSISNSNNTIQNNEITKGINTPFVGILNNGNGAYPNENNLIHGNLIYDIPTAIRINANTLNNTYSNNEITQTTSVSANIYGFNLGATNISGEKLLGNYIHDLFGTNVYAFNLNGYTSTALTIANNIINLGGNSTTIYGIYDGVTTSSMSYNVYYNTILISGDGGGQTACYYKKDHPNTIVKNNNFTNTRTSSIGGVHSVLYFEYQSTPWPSANTEFDYNNFYKGDAKNFCVYGPSGNQTILNSYSEFKALWTQDLNSKNVMPSFKSSSNLHINSWVSSPISGGGTPISGITTDFDGETRDARIPDIGADEFLATSSHQWVATTSTDWANPSNWDKGTVPDGSSDVDIPTGKTVTISSSNNIAQCNNIFIGQGASLSVLPGKSLTVNGEVYNSGTLTVKADGVSQGSLIHNTANVTGTIERSMQHGRWELVSTPVKDQNLHSFVNNSINDIATSVPVAPDYVTYYGIRDYIESSNIWNGFFTADNLSNYGTIHQGEGYAFRRTSDANANNPNDNKIAFTGSLEVGSISTAINRTDGRSGWFPVGNPYSAPLILNSSVGPASFLDYNSSSLDPNHVAVYVWDENNQLTYRTINHATSASFIPVATAFFVRAKLGATSVMFTPGMRVHEAGIVFEAPTFRRSIVSPWSGFDLVANTSLGDINTTIKMNSSMTDGLDVSYDAGFLRVSNNYALYTKLVADNGTSFAIQSINDNVQARKIIPVGFDYMAGGTVKFMPASFSLPGDISIQFEDRAEGLFTTFDSPSSSYQVTVPANTTGTGRFYIHLVNSLATGGPHQDIQRNITVVPTGFGGLNILGEIGSNATATIYNASGINLGQFQLLDHSNNNIQIGNLSRGIYLVDIQSNFGRRVVKFKL